MKWMLFALLALNSAVAYECEKFLQDENKKETLEHVVTETLAYESLEAFCSEHDYLDLELTFMPNYFKYQEEDDDHYRLMIHKAYSSCTFIYNITHKFVTDKSCYSTW